MTGYPLSRPINTLDDIPDVSAPSPSLNHVLKWNGSAWIPAEYDATFDFLIAAFDDGQASTQLIGSGVWKGIGDLSFSASYINGPPTEASIDISSTGGVSWAAALELLDPFTSGVSVETTDYPSARDQSVTFTLTATKGTETVTSSVTVTFRNQIKYGSTLEASGWDSADILALAGALLSNVHTGSFVIPDVGAGYILFAFPSAYTNIHATGFLFNSIACPFESPETVSVTNSAGYTENYKVYRSTAASLGAGTLVASTLSNLTNLIHWGVTSKASGYDSADVQALVSNTPSNTKGRVITANAAGGEYIVYALPVRLGTVVFWQGGLEGGFQAPETVSVTNENGYVENYYVYRSTNSGLGQTTITVV